MVRPAFPRLTAYQARLNLPVVPFLLKASDLVSAHILRGRMDAEGFEVSVVHENASWIWGGAVCGGPVLLAPGEAFPEIEEAVAAVEPVDPPLTEVGDEGASGFATDPGVFGALLIGTTLAGLFLLTLVVTENLWISIDTILNNPEWLSYGLPIPWYVPGWQEVLPVLGGGVLGGILAYYLICSLKRPPIRGLVAGLILIFVYGPYGMAVLLALVVLVPFVSLVSSGRSRRAQP